MKFDKESEFNKVDSLNLTLDDMIGVLKERQNYALIRSSQTKYRFLSMFYNCALHDPEIVNDVIKNMNWSGFNEHKGAIILSVLDFCLIHIKRPIINFENLSNYSRQTSSCTRSKIVSLFDNASVVVKNCVVTSKSGINCNSSLLYPIWFNENVIGTGENPYDNKPYNPKVSTFKTLHSIVSMTNRPFHDITASILINNISLYLFNAENFKMIMDLDQFEFIKLLNRNRDRVKDVILRNIDIPKSKYAELNLIDDIIEETTTELFLTGIMSRNSKSLNGLKSIRKAFRVITSG